MDNNRLLKHSFQFISFCYVYHENAGGGGININDDTHLIHVTKGTGLAVIQQKQYRLKRGAVIAIPRFVEFVLNIQPDFEMLNIHYKLRLADGEFLDDNAILPIVFRPAYFDQAERTLRRMRKLLQKNIPTSLTAASLAHSLVLRHLTSNRLTPRMNSTADARIRRVYRKLLSSDYHRYDSTELADHCHLSVSQMNRIFTRYFQLSPHRFWKQQRFRNACLSLKNRGEPIAGIAREFGFQDQAYFSRWFKQMAKVSPLAYRKKLAETHF